MDAASCRRIDFSSSVRTYGETQYFTFDEGHPIAPTNLYGLTKAMTEGGIRGWIATTPSASAVLRDYSNPVGAHESSRIGEDQQVTPSSLMPFGAQVSVLRRAKFSIFGTTIRPVMAPRRAIISTLSISRGATRCTELQRRNERLARHQRRHVTRRHGNSTKRFSKAAQSTRIIIAICGATLSVDDIIAGILLALDYAPRDSGQIKPGRFATPLHLYNVGNNPPEKLIDLIGAIERAYGRRAEINMPPMQDGDVYQTLADIDDIARDLSIAPSTPIDVSIPLLVE